MELAENDDDHLMTMMTEYQPNISMAFNNIESFDLDSSNLSFTDDLYPDECLDHYQNISYINVTCEALVTYSVPLYGYLTPVFLLITVVANTLIVLVLSKRSMASPTNFVLMGMALCDMFTVLFPAPGLIYMFTFGNHYKPLSPVSMCYAYVAFNEIFPAMFHTASIWLTLALAAQRYIYVCHAAVARTWCTIPRVKRCTLYICIAALLHQSTRFFDRTITAVHIEWNGNETEVCTSDIANWVYHLGPNIYHIWYFLFRVFFVHLIPCVTLVTLNIFLFRAMKRAQERREKLLRENRKKECKKLRDANCTTLMLIVVVTVFLIVEIPLAVITVMHIISTAVTEFLDYDVANICILFSNFLLVVSYPINFAIYCGMSRQFRETFKEIFVKRNSNNSVANSKKDCSSKYSLVNGPRTCTNETVL